MHFVLILFAYQKFPFTHSSPVHEPCICMMQFFVVVIVVVIWNPPCIVVQLDKNATCNGHWAHKSHAAVRIPVC